MDLKYKHVSEDKVEEYQSLDKEGCIAALRTQSAYLDDMVNKKKTSEVLKELRGEVNEYRKKWNKENPDQVAELDRLKAQADDIKAERDKRILSDLDEKADLEGGFNDSINGCKEHIDCLVHCLRFLD